MIWVDSLVRFAETSVRLVEAEVEEERLAVGNLVQNRVNPLWYLFHVPGTRTGNKVVEAIVDRTHAHFPEDLVQVCRLLDASLQMLIATVHPGPVSVFPESIGKESDAFARWLGKPGDTKSHGGPSCEDRGPGWCTLRRRCVSAIETHCLTGKLIQVWSDVKPFDVAVAGNPSADSCDRRIAPGGYSEDWPRRLLLKAAGQEL